jgi:translation initiation factor 4G
MLSSDGRTIRGGLLFRKYLLNRCQEAFEENSRPQESDKSVTRGSEPRRLRLIAFVGELYDVEILSTKVIHSCIVKLLCNVVDPEDSDVESLCTLVRVVGAKLEAQPRMAEQMQPYIQRMKDLTKSQHIPSRIKKKVLVGTFHFSWHRATHSDLGRMSLNYTLETESQSRSPKGNLRPWHCI